jgi:hypothetical protein
MRRPVATLATLALLEVALLGLAGSAAAKGGQLGNAQVAPRKLEHPFLRGLIGTWDWVSTTAAGEDARGTETFRLGLLDTVVIDDIEGKASEQVFQGHGVWKVSDDGTLLTAWWFFSTHASAEVYQGALTADGYDVKNERGERITLTKTPLGLELKAYKGDVVTRTVRFTRRGQARGA